MNRDDRAARRRIRIRRNRRWSSVRETVYLGGVLLIILIAIWLTE